MKLYELTDALKGFEYEFDEDGVWTNEEEFNALELSKDEKVQNCLYAAKNYDAEIKTYEAEISRLQRKKRSAERGKDRLKEYIAFCLDGEKWQREGCPLKVSYTTSHPLVMREEVEEHPENFLPSAYLNHKEEWTAKKDEIKKAIKMGQKFDGCEIGEKKSVVIR